MKIINDTLNKQINFLDERFYTIDQITYYPSVTTVLEVWPKGNGYIQWLKDLGHNADVVVKKAGEQGTVVHNLIDKYLGGSNVTWCNEGGIPVYSLEEWMMFLKFVDFFETYKPKIITHEEQIVSETMGLGGTIDLVCNIGDEIWLIDNKTSNAIHTSYELQMAAYAMMWNEKYPKRKIDRTGVMWLKAPTRGGDKSGNKIQGKGWQVKEFDRHYTASYKLFQHARAIWDEENPNYVPKNIIYPSEVKINL